MTGLRSPHTSRDLSRMLTLQAGYLRKMKPFIKKLDLVIVRIMGENKFEVTTTEILLMAIVLCLLVVVFENADRPVVTVTKKKKE